MDKQPDELHKKLNTTKIELHENQIIIPYIANSYITIRITNIPCNWPAGPKAAGPCFSDTHLYTH